MNAALDSGFFSCYATSPAVLQDERVRRGQALLAERGWDALLVVSGAALGQRGNVRFLTNYPTTTRYSVVLFPARGDAILFVPYPVHVYWAEGLTWVPNVRFSSNIARDVAAAVREMAVQRLAVAGKELLPAGLESALSDQLAPTALQDGGAPFRGVRQVKGAADQAGMFIAARLADEAFRHILPLVRPGVTENDLFAEIQFFLRKEGAEDSLVLISSTSLRAHPIPSHRPLAAGDVLQLSIEPIAPGGYWCQTIRVISLGEPSPDLLRGYAACLDGQQAMEAWLQPGVLANEVCAHGQRALGDLAGTDLTPLGHGMGLDLGEPPRIEPGDATPLQPDMFLTLHPSVHLGRVGVFIGDTYHLTSQGARRLSTLAREIVVIP